MNDIKFANKIRQALNEGSQVDGRISERLRAAREQALAARRISAGGEREPALARARGTVAGSFGTASTFGSFGGLGGFSLRVVLPMLLLVAGLVSIYSWQQEQRAADAEELDAQLLTDDLPIDAYLDRGFEAWLKKVSSGNPPDSN